MFCHNGHDNPCFNCTERRLHCHSECDAYKAFQAKREESRKKGEQIALINEALYAGAARRYHGLKQRKPCSKERKHDLMPGSSRTLKR